MRRYNVLIVEDERLAQANLKRALERDFDDINIVGTLDSVSSTVEWLKREENHADIIFMDVELSDGMCFDIFSQVEVRSKVVITTAFDNYAVKAFRINSIDYLLKPISAADVKRALTKLERLTGAERKAYTERQQRIAPRGQESFLIHIRDKIIPLHRDKIAYCYTTNERVTACDFEGTHYPLDKTLEAMQALLPASDFFRANRQFIISRKAVREISVWFGSRLSLGLVVDVPEKIIISKARVPEFKGWLRADSSPAAVGEEL